MTGFVTMSKGGFAESRGRTPEYDEAMTSDKVMMTPSQWNTLEDLASLKKAKTGKKKVSVSEIIRDLLQPIFSGGTITANVKLEGYVMGHQSQDVRPIIEKGRAPTLEIPFIEAVEGSGYYALTVIGNVLENKEDPSASIPDGYVLVMRRESKGIDGALMHIEWKEDGKSFTALRRVKMNLNGSVTLTPLNKKQKPVTLKPEDYKVYGVVARAWDGGSEE